ncbi:hypothetical protein J6590_009662 [Homalodisca vitripennis]|nr:hypothetical protein J6590_009662 [Homalodisca vitripennis]
MIPHPRDSWLEGSLETSVEGKEIVGVMSNLHPATTYSVQIVAENSLGVGEPSLELRVTTDEEAPSATARNIKVEATSSTQLIVTWDTPASDHWNGVLLGHYVGHREAGELEKQGVSSQKKYNFTTVLLRGSGKEEIRLTRLSKFCKYAIVVQAYNKRGAGPLSPEVLAQTLEDVPEASPRQIQCEPASPESLQVTWQPPPETLVHGIIQGYRLYYEPTEDMQDVTQVQTKITTALTTKLHGLLKYTNYSIEILAFTRVGDGAKSERIYCRTKEDANSLLCLRLLPPLPTMDPRHRPSSPSPSCQIAHCSRHRRQCALPTSQGTPRDSATCTSTLTSPPPVLSHASSPSDKQSLPHQTSPTHPPVLYRLLLQQLLGLRPRMLLCLSCHHRFHRQLLGPLRLACRHPRPVVNYVSA